MILKNKLTRETLNITYPDFRKNFSKEIQAAFESYRQTQLNKYSYNFKDDNSMEFNFYFELQWNFNHLKYCKTEELIKTCCNFQVRRLTSKNEFSMTRIIFEGD